MAGERKLYLYVVQYRVQTLCPRCSKWRVESGARSVLMRPRTPPPMLTVRHTRWLAAHVSNCRRVVGSSQRRRYRPWGPCCTSSLSRGCFLHICFLLICILSMSAFWILSPKSPPRLPPAGATDPEMMVASLVTRGNPEHGTLTPRNSTSSAVQAQRA